LTGTDPAMFDAEFLRHTASMTVSNGRVTMD